MTLKELIEKCGGSTGGAVHEWCDFRTEISRLALEFAHQSWREGFHHHGSHEAGSPYAEATEAATKAFHQLFDTLFN